MKRFSWVCVAMLAGTLSASGPALGMIVPLDGTASAQTGGGGGGGGAVAVSGFGGGGYVGVTDGGGGVAVSGFGGGGYGPAGGGGGGGIGLILPNEIHALMGARLAAVGPESQAAQAALRAAQARQRTASEKLKTTRSRVETGQAPQTDLSEAEAEAEYEEALANVAEQEAELASLRGIFGLPSAVGGKLTKPVDVQLRQSTVRQAAEALVRASGVPIEVGESVPKDLRITIDARRMPLASVLEAIAKPTGLMIAPEGEGVRLDMWPSLTVDGVKTTQKSGRMAPWSDEWGIPPTRFLHIPDAVSMLPGILGGSDAGSGGVSRGIFNSGARPAGLEVSATGDMVVVSEVGKNEKGEAGLWITAYRVAGGKMETAGSTFHPFRGNTSGNLDASMLGALTLRLPVEPVRPAKPPAPARPPANR